MSARPVSATRSSSSEVIALDLVLLPPEPWRPEHRVGHGCPVTELRRRADILRDGKPRKEPATLKRPRYAEPHDRRGGKPLDRLAVEQNGAAVGALEAAHHVEKGAFAGAVRADHADDLAFADGDLVVLQGNQAAERFGEPARQQQRFRADSAIDRRHAPPRPNSNRPVNFDQREFQVKPAMTMPNREPVEAIDRCVARGEGPAPRRRALERKNASREADHRLHLRNRGARARQGISRERACRRGSSAGSAGSPPTP